MTEVIFNLIKYPDDYNPILKYWEQIQNGDVVVSKKVRRTYQYIVEKVKNPDEYFFSSKRSNHVIEFFENFCRHSKGKMGGQLVRLELWEKAFLATVFGFVNINGLRQFTEAVLIVAKKNGKSLLASGIGLYLQIADSEPGAEIYAVATKKDQAKIIWNEAKHMVLKSPDLRKRIKPLVAELSSDAFNDGFFKPLASDTDTMDGLNVHGCLMDEVHQWRNGRALYDIMADGVTAREQPLILITSTAGTVRGDIYDEKYEEAERLVKGYDDPNGYHDEHRIMFVYEIDEKEEWQNPECWQKANPGLGTIKNYDSLAQKVDRAKQNPALVKNLVCKEFNVRETSTEAWLTFEELNNEATFDIAELKPRYGIGGCDLSSTTDLTNATVIFKVPNDPHMYVIQMYFIPEDLLDFKVKQDKIPYDLWLEQGLLRTTPGNKVHYKYVCEWFDEVQRDMDCYIFKCGYDSWSATYFVEDMKARFGQNVMDPVIQGKKTLSSPMHDLGADLKNKLIVYNNNPILKWCLINTEVDVDRNGNIQPTKGISKIKRIDGLAGLLDAYVVYERYLEQYMAII